MSCLYCFQCCRSTPKSESDMDVSTHVEDMHIKTEKEKVQPSYNFRRHSSYTTAGTYRPVLVQPQKYTSESFSSSDDESPTFERSRCWSTISSNSNTKELASLVNGLKSKEVDFYHQWSPIKNILRSDKSSLLYDKLEEISEIGDNKYMDDSSNVEDYRWESEDYGTLIFNTTYDPYDQKLTISVECANELPKRGDLSEYDTFVKIAITSDLKNFHVTQPVRKNRDPQYKEEFIIYITRSKSKVVRNHFLRLSIFECDRQGRYDAIGHVTIPMAKVLEQNHQNFTSKITPMLLPIKNIGQILVGLSFSKSLSRLSVNIIKGRHLKFNELMTKYSFYSLNKESCNTFVKVRFMVGGRKVRSTRSRVILDSIDPLYRHKSSFVMPLHYVMDSSIAITISVKSIFGRNIPLGRAIIGPYTETAKGNLTQWGKMLQEFKSVVQWRNLYV